MARARNIKPGLFKNEILAECSPLARILFTGLWCEADREGRLEDRPKRIKAAVLPYDDCVIDDLITELAQREFLLRYEAGGVRYIQILNFLKHQQPHHKEVASVIPAPVQSSSHAQAKHGSSMVQVSGNQSASCPTDCLVLIPDSLNPQPDGNQSLPGSFARFWLAYPKKKSRGQALKAWQKIKPSEQLVTEILAGIERAKTSAEWERDAGKFIPHPATWLNAEGWLDEMTQDEPSGFFKEKASAAN